MLGVSVRLQESAPLVVAYSLGRLMREGGRRPRPCLDLAEMVRSAP